MYYSIIHGLVIRDSTYLRTRSPHRRAGLTKLQDGDTPSCKRQPSLSPFTYEGFGVSASPVPHTLARACMGRVGVNTGARYLRESAEQPVREGLRKVYGSSGDNRPVFRVNRGVMRTLGLFVLFGCDEAERGRKRADTLVSPLAELWRNE